MSQTESGVPGSWFSATIGFVVGTTRASRCPMASREERVRRSEGAMAAIHCCWLIVQYAAMQLSQRNCSPADGEDRRASVSTCLVQVAARDCGPSATAVGAAYG